MVCHHITERVTNYNGLLVNKLAHCCSRCGCGMAQLLQAASMLKVMPDQLKGTLKGARPQPHK